MGRSLSEQKCLCTDADQSTTILHCSRARSDVVRGRSILIIEAELAGWFFFYKNIVDRKMGIPEAVSQVSGTSGSD